MAEVQAGMGNGGTLPRWVVPACAALLAAAFALVLWHLDRGFDFSDEGVYYLNFQYPEEFPAGFTQYHLFGAWLYQLFGGSIPALRLTPWLLLLGGTFFFWTGWLNFFRRVAPEFFANPWSAPAALVLLLASVFISFSWPPPGISYNSMADFGLLLGAGSLLHVATPSAHPSARILGMAGFALSLIFLLMVKGSSAVGLTLAGGLFLLLIPTLPWRWKLSLLSLAFLAAALALAALWLLAGDQLARVAEFFLAHSRNFFGALWSGSSVDPMLQRHWEEVWQLPWRMFLSYNLPMLVALGLGLLGRWRPVWFRPPSRWFELALLLAFATLVVSIYSKHGYLAGITHRHGSILAYTAILGLLLALLPARATATSRGYPLAPSPTPGRLFTLVLAGLFLFALPFLVAAGTTHRIYINALLHLGPFFALIFVVALAVSHRVQSATPWLLTLVLTTLVALSQFFHGSFLRPYRLPQPLWTMHEATPIGHPASQLRLDPASARFVHDLQNLLNQADYQPGDDLLALFDMPGVVFALGGKSPGRPWYFPNYGEQGERENLASLRIAGRERISRSLILQSNNDPRIAEYLASLDLRFPEDYQYIGQAWQPYRNWSVAVWRPLRPIPQ